MKHVPWKTLAEKPVLQERGWEIFCETVEYPDGTRGSDCYIHRGAGGAVVFALTEDGQLVLNRQYKHGAKDVVCELAIGAIKGADASPLETAQRELLEETGYGGGVWSPLGALFPNATLSRAKVHAFLARGVRKVAEPVVDPREMIEVMLVDPAAVPDMVARGELATEASVATAFKALLKLNLLTTRT